jgi:hypothetical protein
MSLHEADFGIDVVAGALGAANVALSVRAAGTRMAMPVWTSQFFGASFRVSPGPNFSSATPNKQDVGTDENTGYEFVTVLSNFAKLLQANAASPDVRAALNSFHPADTGLEALATLTRLAASHGPPKSHCSSA